MSGFDSLSGSGYSVEGKLGLKKLKTSWCFVVVSVTCCSSAGGIVAVLGSAVKIGGVEAGVAVAWR